MPNQAHSRRDPQKGKNGFSTSKGFTLIEMMIVIAVIAILASLALPSYRSIIEKRAVTSGAKQVKAFMSAAQLTSVKRNQYVAVNFESWVDGGEKAWCFGFIADDAPDTSCNCHTGDDCKIDGALKVIESSSLNYPEVLSSATVGGVDNNLVFDPIRGMILNRETAEVKLISPDQSSYALNIEISVTGRASICSDSDRASKTVPGYKSC